MSQSGSDSSQLWLMEFETQTIRDAVYDRYFEKLKVHIEGSLGIILLGRIEDKEAIFDWCTDEFESPTVEISNLSHDEATVDADGTWLRFAYVPSTASVFIGTIGSTETHNNLCHRVGLIVRNPEFERHWIVYPNGHQERRIDVEEAPVDGSPGTDASREDRRNDSAYINSIPEYLFPLGSFHLGTITITSVRINIIIYSARFGQKAQSDISEEEGLIIAKATGLWKPELKISLTHLD